MGIGFKVIALSPWIGLLPLNVATIGTARWREQVGEAEPSGRCPSRRQRRWHLRRLNRRRRPEAPFHGGLDG
jgi:hypothetical protein